MDTEHDLEKTIRLGIDFGVSTTVIVMDDPGRDYPSVELPGISRAVPGIAPGSIVHIVPSLIWYKGDGAARIGDEVLTGGGEELPSTACNLRSYLFGNSPVQVPAGNDRMVRYADAAGEFLKGVLSRAVTLCPDGAELVFTLPADAPAEYPAWLDQIGRAAGARSCSWVNEFMAAATGYGISPAAGEPFLVFSFTTTDITATAAVSDEHGVKIAGQASVSTGCQAVDGWIVQDLLARFRILMSEPRAERIKSQVLREAQRARELIPQTGLAGITVTDPVQGRTYTARYGTVDIARVLEEHGLVLTVQQVLDRLLSALRVKGMDERRICAVLLTGPGCTLPGIADYIRDRFPGVPVHDNHLLDAVSRGAAGTTAPARAPDRITGSYALRYWDPAAKEHHYRFLVHSGARFPSNGQVARITISAAYDGQTHLGIPLCGIAGSGEGSCGIELVSDRAGGVHVAGPGEDAGAQARVVPLYEQNPVLLVADPPAKKGEPRFECTFTIDRERYLCLSARDLVTGTLQKLNAPVFRLT
ncbi:rod shape-determining protein [uncultured Methanoregula sp.]|uniref:rod shape-determining protein n=1 Tax=uncultured Methanoregula sp. TaxID=1005933 RepID=UPI002AAA8B4F|nr:rod shape-determining protein [uncultured Methanoregula sp.]